MPTRGQWNRHRRFLDNERKSLSVHSFQEIVQASNFRSEEVGISDVPRLVERDYIFAMTFNPRRGGNCYGFSLGQMILSFAWKRANLEKVNV